MDKKASRGRRTAAWTALIAALLLVPCTALADKEREAARKGIESYSKRIDKNPNEAENYYKLARAYITLERYGEARPPLTTYLDKRPDDMKGQFWMGRVLEELSDCKAALGHYEKGLELSKTDGEGAKVKPILLAQIGSCQKELGKLDEAVASLEASLEAGAKNKVAILATLGSVYNKMGKPDKARETFDKVIAMDPENPTVHFNLGVILREQGKKTYDSATFLQAAQSFAKAAELGRDAEAYFLAAETYLFANDMEAARPFLEKYLKMAPEGRSASDAREYLKMYE
jgi:tetratricopeptide (TPR) repeat protein